MSEIDEKQAELRADIKRRVLESTERSKALQLQAITLYKQYGLFLPGPVKEFFHKLADHMHWNDLMKAMKK